eukprot:2929984-Pyramimonas_sp.AAC.1
MFSGFAERRAGQQDAPRMEDFSVFEDEVTHSNCPLRSRLWLFDPFVIPRALHGADCWTLTADLDWRSIKNERHMPLLVVGFEEEEHARL